MEQSLRQPTRSPGKLGSGALYMCSGWKGRTTPQIFFLPQHRMYWEGQLLLDRHSWWLSGSRDVSFPLLSTERSSNSTVSSTQCTLLSQLHYPLNSLPCEVLQRLKPRGLWSFSTNFFTILSMTLEGPGSLPIGVGFLYPSYQVSILFIVTPSTDVSARKFNIHASFALSFQSRGVLQLSLSARTTCPNTDALRPETRVNGIWTGSDPDHKRIKTPSSRHLHMSR